MEITDDIESELIHIWATDGITRYDEHHALYLAEREFKRINLLTVSGIFSDYCHNTGC